MTCWFSKRTLCLLLILLTLGTFAKVTTCGFLEMDDDAYVWLNPNVQAGLTWNGLIWALSADLLFDTPNADYWQPCTTLSHMMVSQLFGLEPSMHHLVNLGLHMVNVVLFFYLVIRLGSKGGHWPLLLCAWLVALFAVHPLKISSVVWVAERKDVLCGMFFLLTLLAYLRHIEKPSAPRWIWVHVLFILGMWSKPMVMTLPFILLLLDFWPLKRAALTFKDRNQWLHLILEKYTLFLLMVILLFMSWLMFRHQLASPPNPLNPLLGAIHKYGFHFYKMCYPTVSIFYSPDYMPMRGDWRIYVFGTLFAVWGIGGYRVRNRRPEILMGWCWFAGMLVPIEFNPVHPEDRFLYLPSLGYFIALGGISMALADSIRSPRTRILCGSLATALVALFAWGSASQIKYWKDSRSLYQHTLNHTPDNWQILNNMGVILLKEKQYPDAYQHFLKAVRLCPEEKKRKFPEYNLCLILLLKNQSFSEIQTFINAEKLKVSFDASLENMLMAHVELQLKQDLVEDASRECQFALEMNPENLTAKVGMAIIHYRLNQFPKSIDTFKAIVKAHPERLEIRNKLAWILSTHEPIQPEQAREAILIASELCRELQFENPMALDTLAVAHAAYGNFDNAKAMIQMAIEKASSSKNESLIKALRLHQALFTKGEKVRSITGQQFPNLYGFSFRLEPIHQKISFDSKR